MRRKRFHARVFLSDSSALEDWYDIDLQGFTKELNAGLGPCIVRRAVPFNYDGGDLRVGNIVEIYVTDADTTDDDGDTDGFGSKLIYRGYISLVTRSIDNGVETVALHLLGFYTLLSLAILKNGSQTTLYSKATVGLTTVSGDQNAADVGAIVRAVLDRNQAENPDTLIFYLGTTDVPDTGTTVTYTLQQKTYREAIDRLKDMAPSNVYWYVDAEGRFTFKEIPETPTHQFIFGKHFSKVQVETSLEKIRNFVLVWDGDPSGTYKHYQDSASIELYGHRAATLNDFGIVNSNAADQIGAKFLAENKDPSVKVLCTISDNNGEGGLGYDIESIEPGDTCSFVGFSSTLDDILWGNMLITKVAYSPSAVQLEIELIKSGVIDVQARQTRDINEITSGGLGVPATYT